jgi:hypothetical protein
VSAVSPSDGATAGGDRVTITGHDFTGATAVSFGGVPAQSFTVDSDSSITAVSPAGAVGLVDVSVTTPGGQSPVSAADRFTYVPRPVVTSVSPARGATGGGTSVTITGHDLTGATAVSFGGQPARGFGVVSDTVITAVSPALPPGTVDVTVTTAGGQSTTGTADHFTYPEVCVVPKLTGKRLRQAKRALGHAHCKLGTVKGPRKGKVNHQSPRHGEVLPADARVNVRLG